MRALAILGGIISVWLLMILGSIFNGYALSVLWSWFMVPTFGVPQLSIAAAIGIALIVIYLTHQTNDCKKEKEESLGLMIANGFIDAILKPSFAIFLGWIVHMFM